MIYGLHLLKEQSGKNFDKGGFFSPAPYIIPSPMITAYRNAWRGLKQPLFSMFLKKRVDYTAGNGGTGFGSPWS
jgi:hypothetical protein